MNAYKVFTHDLCSPIQGGEPVWDGALPHSLPQVLVDESQTECAAGWNACSEPHTALCIAGLWPNGRPSRLFVVTAPDATVLVRGDKLRAPTWDLISEQTEDEIGGHVRRQSEVFGEHAEIMASEQMAWRHALARPGYAPEQVEQYLTAALAARGLQWELKRYEAARDAWDARDAWAALAAWDAWAAQDALAAWDAWAARDAWAAWDAWAARDALTVQFASVQQWISHPADLLTVGLRDAYLCGLEIALPTEPNTLGWAMRAP